MKIKTMIVDDNEHDRYILKRHLKRCSFEAEISEATDGFGAIEYFEADHPQTEDGYPPDIIFLDINMPRVTGFEFLAHFATLRGAKNLGATVVVMFTSSPRQDDKDRAAQWGFVSNFLVKGDFETADLERIVAAHGGDLAA